MMRLIILFIITFSAHLSRAQVQVPVKDEPHHHNIFENEYLRILDVHIGPGDTTLYHIHSTPSVFLSLSKTLNTSQLLGRNPGRGGTSTPGQLSYDSLGVTRIHRVWNPDTSWFHVMDIELTSGKPKGNVKPIQHPSLKIAFNRYLAIGYNLQLNAGEVIDLPPSVLGYLIISKEDATTTYRANNGVQNRLMKPGHFIWVEGNNAASLTAFNTPASFAILQLK